jgi:hypothetical protein
VADDNDSAERAKELLVYGPIGLALFVRDSAPQFMRMFVARGKTELQQRSRSVGSQLDQVRSLGESVTSENGPEVLKVLATGIATLREKAEEALQALGVNTSDAPVPTAPRTATAPQPSAAPLVEPVGVSADLAISGYDDLSASQIVDHLDGLTAADLAAIRDYEASHRARNTILGKIEQLTRGS